MPLAISTYHPLPLARGGAGLAAWLALLKLCIQETVDKTHYSVDMVLAVACTALVWHWRSGLYPTTAAWPPRAPSAPPDPVPLKLGALAIGVLVVVFVGVAGV